MIDIPLPSNLGAYHLIQLLGQGNFGTVFEVRDIILGRRLALKVIPIDDGNDANEIQRKLEEALLQYHSRHPNVVQVNRVVPLQLDGDKFVGIEMEFVEGQSLQDVLRSRFVSCQDCLTIFPQVLNGLEHLHTSGVIHCDVKPSNIMVAESRVRLADFGLARIMSRSQALYEDIAYQSHRAPECYAGSPFSVQSDIYATGMTLLRCLNNISDWEETCSRVVGLEGVLRSGSLVKSVGFKPYVPSRLRHIVTKATHQKAAHRYQSASEMQAALNTLRPFIDWHQATPLTWNGVQHVTKSHDNEYTLTISGRSIEVRHNGRRLLSKCCSYERPEQATAAAYQYIAETTLT